MSEIEFSGLEKITMKSVLFGFKRLTCFKISLYFNIVRNVCFNTYKNVISLWNISRVKIIILLS